MRFKLVGQAEPDAVRIEVVKNFADGDVEISVNGNMVAYFDDDAEAFVVWRDALEDEGIGFRED